MLDGKMIFGGQVWGSGLGDLLTPNNYFWSAFHFSSSLTDPNRLNKEDVS